MMNHLVAAVSIVLVASSVARADTTCSSDFAAVTPQPSELVKLCPDEKVLAQPADVEQTGNKMFCSYTFGHMQAMPSVPQGRLRVGSNAGTTVADAKKHTDPKADAESTARGMGKDFKGSVTKMPWKNVDAYRVDSTLAGTAQTGDVFYVKSSKGVVTVQLKTGNKIPGCVEKVADYVAHH